MLRAMPLLEYCIQEWQKKQDVLKFKTAISLQPLNEFLQNKDQIVW